MSGKQLGPIRCKICEGEHRGTLCTKFNTIKVLPQPKPLQISGPKPKKAKRAARAK